MSVQLVTINKIRNGNILLLLLLSSNGWTVWNEYNINIQQKIALSRVPLTKTYKQTIPTRTSFQVKFTRKRNDYILKLRHSRIKKRNAWKVRKLKFTESEELTTNWIEETRVKSMEGGEIIKKPHHLICGWEIRKLNIDWKGRWGYLTTVVKNDNFNEQNTLS